MLKKSDGFSVIDTMAALGTMLILIAGITPIFFQIYLERMNIQSNFVALELLHNQLQAEFYNDDQSVIKPITRNHILYDFIIEEENSFVKACVKWTNYSHRLNEKCGYIYK